MGLDIIGTNGQSYSLVVLADYGWLCVTKPMPKDSAKYNITHNLSGARIAGFRKLSEAKQVAKEWEELGCWNWSDYKVLTQFQITGIRDLVQSTTGFDLSDLTRK